MHINQQVDLLLEKAHEYAENALQHLPLRQIEAKEPELVLDREAMAARLRIQFIFPQLKGYQIQWLLAMYWQRQTLARMVNTPQIGLSQRLRSQADGATRKIEEAFMMLRAKIQEQITLTSLSPVQRDILDREFLNVPFVEAFE